MGVEPFLIASTVRVVIGQRLVRRLCPECREQYVPDGDVIASVKDRFGLGEATAFSRVNELEKQALQAGIGAKDGGKHDAAELSTDSKTIATLWKAHESGCNACNHSGYYGRMGVYEVLSNNTAIQKLIMASATSEDLEARAVQDGMVTMQMDGLIKALRGQTTIEEVMRVTSTEG
jgi:type IV pilus assembly protein PilB